jgi:hypothetical protein
LGRRSRKRRRLGAALPPGISAHAETAICKLGLILPMALRLDFYSFLHDLGAAPSSGLAGSNKGDAGYTERAKNQTRIINNFSNTCEASVSAHYFFAIRKALHRK